jgi:protease-4
MVNLHWGWHKVKPYRDELEQFKKSGKICYGYANTYSQKSYLNCSNTIYLNPVGDLDFKRFIPLKLCFKVYRKIRDKMEVIRHGKYKGL